MLYFTHPGGAPGIPDQSPCAPGILHPLRARIGCRIRRASSTSTLLRRDRASESRSARRPGPSPRNRTPGSSRCFPSTLARWIRGGVFDRSIANDPPAFRPALSRGWQNSAIPLGLAGSLLYERGLLESQPPLGEAIFQPVEG